MLSIATATGAAFTPRVDVAAQAITNITPGSLHVGGLTGGEYFRLTDAKSLDCSLETIGNHLPNRYFLTFHPQSPHPGLDAISLHDRTTQISWSPREAAIGRMGPAFPPILPLASLDSRIAQARPASAVSTVRAGEDLSPQLPLPTEEP